MEAKRCTAIQSIYCKFFDLQPEAANISFSDDSIEAKNLLVLRDWYRFMLRIAGFLSVLHVQSERYGLTISSRESDSSEALIARDVRDSSYANYARLPVPQRYRF